MTNKSVLNNPVIRTALLLAALLAIGLVTRFPALQFPYLYALHGVLSAPFFSALALWHFNRGGGVWALAIALGAMAAVLGMMSPVMSLSFVLLAVLTLAAYGLLLRAKSSKRNLVCAVAFGALGYPCTLTVGIASGSYLGFMESLPAIFILFIIALGLSLFAVLLLARTGIDDEVL